jgi:ribosomal protein S27E
MGKIVDITGKRFGRIVVLSFSHINNRKAFWNCKCDCGNIKIIFGSSLKNGETKSCGCLQKEVTKNRFTKHGLRHNPIHKVWSGMVQRCTNKNVPHYSYYGGRGITVCDEWLTVEGFYKDMGERPKGTTLDRINNELGYFKDNCRWVTSEEQSNNKRSSVKITYKGKTQTLSQWAKEYNMKRETLYGRVTLAKWSIEKAITTPVRHSK